MKPSIPLVFAALVLSAVSTSCTTLASQSARGGGVYLVGVAGGG